MFRESDNFNYMFLHKKILFLRAEDYCNIQEEKLQVI